MNRLSQNVDRSIGAFLSRPRRPLRLQQDMFFAEYTAEAVAQVTRARQAGAGRVAVFACSKGPNMQTRSAHANTQLELAV
jgi:hypothetical protein